MAPTRVGLVGLAGVAVNGPAMHTWAILAHLPTYLNSPDYELVAVCNSSVESAQRAIDFHKIPNAKAYGNPKDLADDPNVDLVVISVHIAKHKMLADPALLKNKQVFVEWPLGASVQESEELAALARRSNVKTVVGAQARADPAVVKLKEIVDSGKLGRITSSTVVGSTSGSWFESWFEGGEYYLDMKTGGNIYDIYFAHFLDTFIHVLGDFDKDTIQALLKNEISELPIFRADGSSGVLQKNTPDHTIVNGILQSGAVASITYRWLHNKEAVDGVGNRWIISGTEGEVVLTSDQEQWQCESVKKIQLKLKGKPAEEVSIDGALPEHVKAVPPQGQNTALAMDAFARGDQTRYADFDSALKTHQLLDVILKKSGFKY